MAWIRGTTGGGDSDGGGVDGGSVLCYVSYEESGQSVTDLCIKPIKKKKTIVHKKLICQLTVVIFIKLRT